MSSAVGLMQGIRSNDVSIAGTLRGQQTIPLHTFLIRGASEHEAEGASEHGPGGASDHEAAAEDNSQHKASDHAPQAEFRRGSGVLMRRCPLDPWRPDDRLPAAAKHLPNSATCPTELGNTMLIAQPAPQYKQVQPNS